MVDQNFSKLSIAYSLELFKNATKIRNIIKSARMANGYNFLLLQKHFAGIIQTIFIRKINKNLIDMLIEIISKCWNG